MNWRAAKLQFGCPPKTFSPGRDHQLGLKVTFSPGRHHQPGLKVRPLVPGVNRARD